MTAAAQGILKRIQRFMAAAAQGISNRIQRFKTEIAQGISSRIQGLKTAAGQGISSRIRTGPSVLPQFGDPHGSFRAPTVWRHSPRGEPVIAPGFVSAVGGMQSGLFLRKRISGVEFRGPVGALVAHCFARRRRHIFREWPRAGPALLPSELRHTWAQLAPPGDSRGRRGRPNFPSMYSKTWIAHMPQGTEATKLLEKRDDHCLDERIHGHGACFGKFLNMHVQVNFEAGCDVVADRARFAGMFGLGGAGEDEEMTPEAVSVFAETDAQSVGYVAWRLAADLVAVMVGDEGGQQGQRALLRDYEVKIAASMVVESFVANLRVPIDSDILKATHMNTSQNVRRYRTKQEQKAMMVASGKPGKKSRKTGKPRYELTRKEASFIYHPPNEKREVIFRLAAKAIAFAPAIVFLSTHNHRWPYISSRIRATWPTDEIKKCGTGIKLT